MKHWAVIVVTEFLFGCKPEKLNSVTIQDEVVFYFSVHPSDILINVGDTLTIKARLGAGFSPGFVILNGVSEIPFTPGRLDSDLVVKHQGGEFAIDGEHFDVIPFERHLQA